MTNRMGTQGIPSFVIRTSPRLRTCTRGGAPMSEETKHSPAEPDSAGGSIGGMPEEILEGGDVTEPRHKDQIITSSGTAPTGGIPVGGATDRVIPDRSIYEKRKD